MLLLIGACFRPQSKVFSRANWKKYEKSGSSLRQRNAGTSNHASPQWLNHSSTLLTCDNHTAQKLQLEITD
ncbi:hypothetical protein P8452_44102 [Trifolium repens]|nr:hypothetical protein P8452_44102 [Trifolium repens]